MKQLELKRVKVVELLNMKSKEKETPKDIKLKELNMKIEKDFAEEVANVHLQNMKLIEKVDQCKKEF